MHRLFLSFVFVTCATAMAQDHFESAPRGFESTEGGLSIDLLGTEDDLRFQQIDTTVRPQPNLNRMSFRRDGSLPDNSRYTSRVVDMAITMSESELDSMSLQFNNNYLANTVVVMNRKSVSFPSWIFRPSNPPASLDLIVYFDRLFSYPGQEVTGHDLLWEVRVYNNTRWSRPYPMDGDVTIPENVIGAGFPVGPEGCWRVGGVQPSRLHAHAFNWGDKFSFQFNVWESARMAPVFGFLGARDDALAVPGLCATLHVAPLAPNLVFPMGSTDINGYRRFEVDPIQYTPALIGLPIYSQAAAYDPGQPPFELTITNGNRTVFPADPPTVPQARRIWAYNASASRATSGFQNGGIIAHFNHT
ncbi:MAG: hypothetical protein AAF628_13450 [Planctomycetota bacterium]